MRTKTLWVQEVYLGQILAGCKTIEVRVGYSNLIRLQLGDILLLNDQYPYRIQRIGRYANFEELLAAEDPARIAPELFPPELLVALQSLYPPEKEALGILAFEITPQIAWFLGGESRRGQNAPVRW